MVVQSSVIHRIQQARDRGAGYLVQHQRADGAIGDPEKEGLGPFYKAIWAFAATGRVEEGNRLASWVGKNLLTEEGDFAGEDVSRCVFDNSYAYPNAWMIVGAHKLVATLAAAHERIYDYSLKVEDARAYAAYGQHSLVGKVLEIHQEQPGRISVVLIRQAVGF